MKYEKTQPKNPHQLTVNQHCFPKKSIERFCNERGVVEVHLIDKNKTVLMKPDHKIFCARRVWDQRAETLFMQGIENPYQDVVSKLEVEGWSRRLSIEQNGIVTDMYSLWHVRCCWKNKYLQDRELVGILPARPAFSQDDREVLEKSNMWTSIDHGTSAVLPGRHIAGFLVQDEWARIRRALRGCYWGVVESKSGEFIVPDISSYRLFLPVTPTILFVGGLHEYCVITEPQLCQLNEQIKLVSEQYYFGRQL